MTKTQISLFQEALMLHEKFGWNLLPVGRPDKNGHLKLPTIEWGDLLVRKTTLEEIERNFTDVKAKGIAVVCGEISGLVVVDIDPKNGGTTEGLDLPDTLVEKTGSGGLHYYYKWRKGIITREIDFKQGVDIISTGGYIICAPSLHHTNPDGSEVRYEWLDNTKEIADAPAWLETADADDSFPVAKYPTWEDLFYKTAYKNRGGRDNSALIVAGWLASHTEIPRTEALAKMEEWVNTIEQPKGDKFPLKTIVEKYDRYRAKDADISVSNPVLQLRRTQAKKGVPGAPYKDETNVFLNLRFYFKERLRYNEFARQIELDGKPMEDSDIMKIVYFMQTTGQLPGVHKSVVFSAIQGFAIGENTYNEPIDWLDTLVWDATPRIDTWLIESTGIEDCEYHRTVGAQWFVNGLVRRLYNPGCIWDYVLVLIGGQGIGKTSLFRIVGANWYKCFTGNVDDKDFYIKCRGAAILDLDEGNALSKSDSIKIKSIITETHDEYRAPYDATTKKYPRQFVFSMSANNEEPFKDSTGNRRYLVIDLGKNKVNFDWLEKNRIQLFAEAIYKLKNKISIPEIPKDIAEEKQEDHRAEDSWTDSIIEFCKNNKYQDSFTLKDVYFGAITSDVNKSIERLDKRSENRIAEVLKKIKSDKFRKTIESTRQTFWTNPFYIELEEGVKKPLTAQQEFDMI